MKLPVLLFSILFLPLNKNCNNVDSETQQSSADQSNVGTTPNDTSITKTHFGVLVAKTEGNLIPPSQQVKVARALGVNYMRARIDIDTWGGSNDAYDIYADAGFKILLNINSGIPRTATGDHNPLAFPTDMTAYSKSVNSILDKYKPEVVVIENEEDNPNYHTGSAEDYIAELKTGIQIAHARGLKVTNGGITVREVCLIIYDDMMQHGEQQKAKDFAQKAFSDALQMRLNNTSNPQITRQIEFGRKIIAAYKTLDLDYVNFHWYEPVQARGQADKANNTFDPSVLSFVADYLKKTTGKPVMSNEFGVFNGAPDLTKNLLQTVTQNKLAYAIFYSADGGSGKAVALQNGLGALRDNGNAFRDFVKQQQ